MRSRIIPQIPETVLSYGLNVERENLLRDAAASLGMKYKKIDPDMAGETVGFLADCGGFASNNTHKTVSGECVIFAALSSKRLDALLKAMRDRRLDIPLKAVVTEHNQSKTVEWLIAELSREHEAMKKAARDN